MLLSSGVVRRPPMLLKNLLSQIFLSSMHSFLKLDLFVVKKLIKYWKEKRAGILIGRVLHKERTNNHLLGAELLSGQPADPPTPI